MSRALVLLAEGSEELEAVTLIDLLRRAGVQVTVAGLQAGPLRASRGVMLLPEVALEAVLEQEFDLLALPGGQPGTKHFKADARVLALVRRMAAAGKLVTAICAAPSVLAAAGVLDGRRATCFPGALDAYPQVQQQRAAVVEDGQFITSRGPGTAMDFALTLIERLCGRAKRDEVEAGLQR
jgi:4-methyl-5(b-hydroxyethyl)-thiazole monophosphate biosynthesis